MHLRIHLTLMPSEVYQCQLHTSYRIPFSVIFPGPPRHIDARELITEYHRQTIQMDITTVKD